MTSVKGDSSARAAVSSDAHVLELLGQLMQRFRDTLAGEDWGGLRGSHFRLLSSVPRKGIRITDLAERLGMTKQASGQFVTFLVGTGHLSVRSDPDDGRVRVVVRTTLGDSTVKVFNARVARMERAWAKVVGPERYADFRQVLHDLGEAM